MDISYIAHIVPQLKKRCAAESLLSKHSKVFSEERWLKTLWWTHGLSVCESYLFCISNHLLFCREVWSDYATFGWFSERYFEKISRGWTNSKSTNIWHVKMYVCGHYILYSASKVSCSTIMVTLEGTQDLLRNQGFAYFAPCSWNNL